MTKDKEASEVKSRKKIASVIPKDGSGTAEKSSLQPKVTTKTPDNHLPLKETQVVKEPEVSNASRSKRSKKRSGKKEKNSASMLRLKIPCQEQFDRSVFLLMKDGDCVNRSAAKRIRIDKDTLFAWELVREKDGYSLVLQSSFMDKSKESRC